MDTKARFRRRIDDSIERALSLAASRDCPPKLAAAMRYAIIPGGARIRPFLTLSVAQACGEASPRVADAAAAAVELLHCASLIHDDLPIFDDAARRRGKPAVHIEFGEQVALLAGDALIVLAFDALARAADEDPIRAARATLAISRGVGAQGGIVAGQAWESEPDVELARYHRAKSAALFEAAVAAGAIAGGGEPEPWVALGSHFGQAYQVADDLLDVFARAADLGKPTGQDVAHGRPNAALELGVDPAVRRLSSHLGSAIAAVPDCPGRDQLRGWVARSVDHFLPAEVRSQVANHV